MYFDEGLYANSSDKQILARQYKELMANRKDPRYKLPFATNASIKPKQLYQEFDDNVIPEFRLDEGENILNAIMPLARPISIGRSTLLNARASDSGKFSQSMTGEQDTIYDGIEYDTDGTLIPINKNGFKTSFRENEMLNLEGFDDLSNKQREGLRTHRKGIVTSMLDGHRNEEGQLIKVDGLTWAGFRADPRVDQVDLSTGTYAFDFTDKTTTGAEVFEAFKSLAERRMTVNNVTAPAAYYVPTAVYWNFQRHYGLNNTQGTIETQLMTIAGVASIQPSSVLTGNEILSLVLSREYIQPIVGMSVSTIARSRPEWNSPLAFDIVSAVGFKVNTDFGSVHKALQYAAG